MRDTSLARLKEQADDLVRQIVRLRVQCERCFANRGTDTAHGHARDYLGTRWDLRNVFYLCRFCHEWLGKSRIRMVVFMAKRLGRATVEELNAAALAITTVREPDMVDLIARLRAILKELS